MTLWPFPDRVLGALGGGRPNRRQPLPGPLGLAAYARLRFGSRDLPQRLRLLVAQLAAERSGCPHCAHRNRHLALQAGLSPADLDCVTDFATGDRYSEPERAALGLADAITRFAEAVQGFAPEILVRARCHFVEEEIMALVRTVTADHFFDSRRGKMGRDALAPSP
jgi:alkylhydroperoxidase family enzyme